MTFIKIKDTHGDIHYVNPAQISNIRESGKYYDVYFGDRNLTFSIDSEYFKKLVAYGAIKIV